MKDLIKIEIERETAKRLKQLKRGEIDTYDKVIRELITKTDVCEVF